MKKSITPFKYTCLIPLIMIYMSIMIFSALLVKKPVSMPYGYTTAATLIFPLWFLMNDILAELYGYKLCKNILWTGFIIQIFFNSISYLLIHLPSPNFWHNQSAFNYIINPLIEINLSTLSAFVISGYINIYLITKWKILLRGKYFWLRSIGSSIVGEFFYAILNVIFCVFMVMPEFQSSNIILWSFFLKVIYIVFLAYPASITVNIIKRIDGIEDFYYDFNPFASKVKV